MSSYNIWTAVADNRGDLVEQILKSTSLTPNSKDVNGYTPMHAASSYNRTDLLRFLIAHGGDANIQDNDGDTPLHVAETVNIAKLLIDEGHADLSIINHEGKTALESIEEEDEFPELIQFLKGRSPEMPKPKKTFQGHPVRMYLSKLENDPSVDLGERRKLIENIMQEDISEEDKDEKLKKIVLDALTSGLRQVKGEGNTQEEDHDSKRRR